MICSMKQKWMWMWMGLVLVLTFSAPTAKALSLGPISDFDDGTLQGWVTPSDNTTNVGGYLEVSGGLGGNLSVFNATVNGVIDPAVTAIEIDLLRPAGSTDLEIRLVLMGPSTSDRWTSTASASVTGDGTWNRYRFSILEADLTQVQGAGSFADLTANLNRLMFRHDPGTPSAGGTFGPSGTFGIDNVIAIPEPNTALLLLAGLGSLAVRRMR
jgi:hypothetical protein